MIYIFTGKGKGKTTAAFGTALRAIGCGKKVHIIQFMKSKDWLKSAEVEFLETVEKKNLEIESFGKKGWVNFKKPSKEDIKLVNKAFSKAVEVVSDEKPFLLVLDEINVAVLFNMLSEKEVLRIINLAKRGKTHLILTGRGATKNMVKEADIVTEMKEIKHLYEDGKGLKAIKGLEY
ncbi:cob(I)yrinic acid a,c-diamide adenosyltransferase [Candidatus Dojkabacteria bacterium]|nr:cob(I)yrinic acid a,c-diamide adenosyltransferase [Candidatus Dojkabacteria bacterium]